VLTEYLPIFTLPLAIQIEELVQKNRMTLKHEDEMKD